MDTAPKRATCARMFHSVTPAARQAHISFGSTLAMSTPLSSSATSVGR